MEILGLENVLTEIKNSDEFEQRIRFSTEDGWWRRAPGRARAQEGLEGPASAPLPLCEAGDSEVFSS